MEIFSEKRDEIGKKIMLLVADSYRDKKIDANQMSLISTQLLDQLPQVQTPEELISFLEDLANKWEIFRPILTVEQGQKVEQQTEEKVEEITKLLNENKVDQAHSVATEEPKQDNA